MDNLDVNIGCKREDISKEKVNELIEQGMSVKDIAEMYQCSKVTIYARLKEKEEKIDDTEKDKRRNCVVCLQHFEPSSNSQICCSDDCKKIRARQIEQKKKPKKKNIRSLSEIQREARLHGMSYGMYIASMQKSQKLSRN